MSMLLLSFVFLLCSHNLTFFFSLSLYLSIYLSILFPSRYFLLFFVGRRSPASLDVSWDRAIRCASLSLFTSSLFLVSHLFVYFLSSSFVLYSPSLFFQSSSSLRQWHLPLVHYTGKFSTASDIWAFGVVMWEMFSFGQQPLHEHTNLQVWCMADW